MSGPHTGIALVNSKDAQPIGYNHLETHSGAVRLNLSLVSAFY